MEAVMEKIIQRWYDMIRINSVNGHEVNLADYIANQLRAMGLEPHYSYSALCLDGSGKRQAGQNADADRPH